MIEFIYTLPDNDGEQEQLRIEVEFSNKSYTGDSMHEQGGWDIDGLEILAFDEDESEIFECLSKHIRDKIEEQARQEVISE